MLHWNSPPLYLADPLIKSCLNNYFFQLKDKHWIFFKKNRTASSIQISFTWFRCFEPFEKRTSRKNSSGVRTEQSVVMLLFNLYFVSNKVGLRAAKIQQLGEIFWKIPHPCVSAIDLQLVLNSILL